MATDQGGRDDDKVGATVPDVRAASAARRSEDRRTASILDVVLQAFPDLYFLIGPDDRIEDYRAGRGASRHVPPERFLGRSVDKVLPPDAARVIQDAIDAARSSGAVATCHYDLSLEIGDRCFEARMARVDAGLVAVFVTDVTERRRTERQLRVSDERYRQIVEAAQEGIWTVDADNRTTFVNRRMADMLGYTPTEMLGRSMSEFSDDGASEENRRDVDRRRTSAAEQYELRLRAKDGSEVWALMSTSPVLDAEGLYAGTTAMAVDITKRKRAEDALRDREARLRAIVESEPECVKVVDAEGRMLEINPAGLAMFEVETSAEIGSLVDMVDPGDRSAWIGLHRKVIAGESGRLEFGITGRRGTRRRVETIATPLHDAHGRVRALLGITRDVTERKRLEEQFWQAQKLESVGRLAGGIAHDFNNLLTAILGYAELLGDKVGPDHAELHEIRRAGERARDLTSRLLTFARRQAVALRVVGLNEIASGMDGLLRRVLGEDVELVTHLGPDVWPVKADPGQIEQVLMNLAVNGRDAMPEGGRLTIQTRNVTIDEIAASMRPGVAPGRYSCLSVADTGVGMTTEVLAHLFEPFFTTKETGRGTGLGLATVYGIVKQCGGHILVESEPGRGATFEILLPRTDAPRETITITPVRTVRGGNETVLLVEDEHPVALLAAEALSLAGYRVVRAANGAEALEIAGRDGASIDLLVTDVVMPLMGGRDLAERLMAERPSLKVLFMSGYTRDEVLDVEALGRGARFLSKPFTPSVLLRAVRETLDASIAP